jgi:DNA-binding winged helix-turn-helix (wHTH) protein
MHYLRRKLEPDPQQTRYVHTMRGIGYRLTMTPIASNGSPEMCRKRQRAVLIKGC